MYRADINIPSNTPHFLKYTPWTFHRTAVAKTNSNCRKLQTTCMRVRVIVIPQELELVENLSLKEVGGNYSVYERPNVDENRVTMNNFLRTSSGVRSSLTQDSTILYTSW